jgi:hypothetical protein
MNSKMVEEKEPVLILTFPPRRRKSLFPRLANLNALSLRLCSGSFRKFVIRPSKPTNPRLPGS